MSDTITLDHKTMKALMRSIVNYPDALTIERVDIAQHFSDGVMETTCTIHGSNSTMSDASVSVLS